ncbi:MAG: class F sortase [Mycobacteriales bacterium]
MSRTTFGGRRGVIATSAAVVLVVVGVVLLVVGLQAQESAPEPPRSAAGTLLDSTAAPTGTPSQSPAARSSAAGPARATSVPPTRTTGKPRAPTAPKTLAATRPSKPAVPPTKGPILPAATPQRLSIPTIGVSSSIMKLGQQKDGSIAVPPVSDPHSPAGWYTGSPSPGQLGPSVLLGHVDSAKYGPGVFFDLGKLRPGDTVDIARSDGVVGVFRIDGVVSYPKDDFPTLAVYGNIDHAGLRLITCGGTFNPGTGHYESNTVAYASLVSSHPS